MEERYDSGGFFAILRDTDSALASRYEELRRRGEENWVHLLSMTEGSHAGLPHLRNVERIADRIIPDGLKGSFSASEIFLLLSAIFLHDIGRTVDPGIGGKAWTPCKEAPEDCPLLNDESSSTRKPSRVPPCQELPEKCHLFSSANRPPCLEHNAIGMKIIIAMGTALGLPDERTAQYCALLTLCHRLDKPPGEKWPPDRCDRSPDTTGDDSGKVRSCLEPARLVGNYRITSLAPYGVVRIPLLASILRIADEADTSWTRSLTKYWYEALGRQGGRPEVLRKAFRRYIEDIEFCHEGQCLIMHVAEMEDLSDDFIKGIKGSRTNLQNVITNWKEPLIEIGVEFKQVYIEYGNRLYGENFDPKAKPEAKPALGEVVGDREAGDQRESVKALLDAIRHLALGTWEYPDFTWQALEGQVGRQLSTVDKWLVKRMGQVSPEVLSVLVTGENRLKITVKDRSGLENLEKEIVGVKRQLEMDIGDN